VIDRIGIHARHKQTGKNRCIQEPTHGLS
jgi:hypothetical protein